MLYGEGNVLVTGVILWDGITRPDKGGKPGEEYTKYSLKIGIPKTAPEIMEIDSILRAELANGEFKGKFPAGGHWGLAEVDPTHFEGKLPAHMSINGVSYRKVQVFDTNNREIPEVAYQNLLYPGAVVRLIVSARTFNNVSKGIGLWLGGIQIIDATAPRLPVGGVDAGKAFGSAPVTGAPLPGVSAPAGMPGIPPAVGAPAMPGPAAPGMPPAVGAPAVGMPPAAAAPTMPGPGLPPGVQPAPDFLKGPQHQMTPKAAGATYEQFKAQGWTDDLLRQHGYML